MKKDREQRRAGGHKGLSRVKTEKIVMLASAALIMSALTATGIYLRGEDELEEIQIDLSGTEDKVDELARDFSDSVEQKKTQQTMEEEQVAFQVTDPGKSLNPEALLHAEEDGEELETFQDTNSDLDVEPEAVEENAGMQKETDTEEPSSTASAKTVETLHFNKEEGLAFPLAGDVIMNYCMDGTEYFATLDQYKVQPGMVIKATEGTAITAAAKAKVLSVEEDPVNGTCVHMDLGDSYELIYGQLKDLQVKEGDLLEKGQLVGYVANPTKYYSLEGVNLYVQVNQNETPVNPITLEP